MIILDDTLNRKNWKSHNWSYYKELAEALQTPTFVEWHKKGTAFFKDCDLDYLNDLPVANEINDHPLTPFLKQPYPSFANSLPKYQFIDQLNNQI